MSARPLIALFATVASLTAACSGRDSVKEASTCTRLQAQIDACVSLPQGARDEFAASCPQETDECRTCLDGRLCGNRRRCDVACGRPSTVPTCADLQVQLNECDTTVQTTNKWFGAFCGLTTEACRTCLDGIVCGAVNTCDSACGVIAVPSGADAGT